MSSNWFFILSTCCSTMESLCFVRTFGCGNDILSSLQGWLTTSESFTCIPTCSPITLCAKHRNRHLDMNIDHCGTWENIGYTSKRWYSRLRMMSRREGKQDNIWKIERPESQKASSQIWNASLQQLLSHPRFFIPSILVCLSIWWTG